MSHLSIISLPIVLKSSTDVHDPMLTDRLYFFSESLHL
jgi:hypothetical protein